MAELAAGLAAQGSGSMMSSISSMVSSLGAATIQSKTATDLQANQIKQQNILLGQAKDSLTKAGIPDYMLYLNGNSNVPNQWYQTSGTNQQESFGVNSNLPYYSTNPMSQIFKAGRPNYNNRDQIVNSDSRINGLETTTMRDRGGFLLTESMDSEMSPGDPRLASSNYSIGSGNYFPSPLGRNSPPPTGYSTPDWHESFNSSFSSIQSQQTYPKGFYGGYPLANPMNRTSSLNRIV